MPSLAAVPTLLASQQLGSDNWPDGNTATGGHGETIDGVSCATSDALHIHSHLAIFKDGQQMALPSHIGIVPNCDYDMHTHDRSGVIHVESPAPNRFTLGQLFSVWGMPLSNDNVAGLTDATQPVVVYINDNFGTSQTGPRLYAGDIREIDMAPQREITIQIGAPLSELPTYDWSNIGPERGF